MNKAGKWYGMSGKLRMVREVLVSGSAMQESTDVEAEVAMLGA